MDADALIDRAEPEYIKCEKYGHSESEFTPAPMTEQERMEMLEECIVELAEIIGGVE